MTASLLVRSQLPVTSMLRLLLASFACLATASISIPLKPISPTVSMPVVSIGTWTNMGGGMENTSQIVHDWLQQGGRGIDTTWAYGDQAQVADAVAAAGLSNEVFITSKVPGCFMVEHFVEADLKLLNRSSIDLMLVHSDIPDFNCHNSWRILEKYQQQGKLKAIGVSNFKKAAL